MKTCFTLLLAFFTVFATQAQESERDIREAERSLRTSKVYVGVSTGLNNPVGIAGLQLGITPTANWAVEVGAGLGTWGTKAQANVQWHPSGIGGFYLKGGMSRAFGLDSLNTDLEVSDGTTREVTIAYRPVNNVNFLAGKSLNFGKAKQHRFYFETGLSFRTQSFNSRYAVLDTNTELSGTSENVLQLLCPGGLVFALGVNFGL